MEDNNDVPDGYYYRLGQPTYRETTVRLLRTSIPEESQPLIPQYENKGLYELVNVITYRMFVNNVDHNHIRKGVRLLDRKVMEAAWFQLVVRKFKSSDNDNYLTSGVDKPLLRKQRDLKIALDERRSQEVERSWEKKKLEFPYLEIEDIPDEHDYVTSDARHEEAYQDEFDKFLKDPSSSNLRFLFVNDLKYFLELCTPGHLNEQRSLEILQPWLREYYGEQGRAVPDAYIPESERIANATNELAEMGLENDGMDMD